MEQLSTAQQELEQFLLAFSLDTLGLFAIADRFPSGGDACYKLCEIAKVAQRYVLNVAAILSGGGDFEQNDSVIAARRFACDFAVILDLHNQPVEQQNEVVSLLGHKLWCESIDLRMRRSDELCAAITRARLSSLRLSNRLRYQTRPF